MQVAVGVSQLKKLPDFIKQRRENFKKLYKGLKDLKEFTLVESQPGSDPSWLGFLITPKDNLSFCRNDIVEYLESHNIQTRNLFAGKMLRHPMFVDLEENQDYRTIGTLKHTDKIMNDSFWIGLYPGMKDEVIDFMIRTICDFVKDRN
jgi:CDP-4-dehydro-6-deoxyglucose reductase, E1